MMALPWETGTITAPPGSLEKIGSEGRASGAQEEPFTASEKDLVQFPRGWIKENSPTKPPASSSATSSGKQEDTDATDEFDMTSYLEAKAGEQEKQQ